MKDYTQIYAYIRYSSEAQSQGDSIARQKSHIKAFELEHNLTVELLSIDKGKSAFHAKHTASGYLGQFIQETEQGKIPPNSLLLVEDLDRLSREQLMPALNQLQQIVTAGVDVYTLKDRRLHSKDSMNDVGSLITSLVTMQRAHEESLTKSKRIKAAIIRTEEKLRQGIAVPYRQLPHWLTYVEGKTTYQVNKYAEPVKLIFSMYLAGEGITAIALHLNAKGLLRKGRTLWSASTISTQLSRRLVLGEWKGYQGVYPAIVSVDDFNAVQALKRKGVGRKSNRTTYINLFVSSVAMCSCGKPMNATRPRGVRRLLCSGTRQGKTGCPHGCRNYNVDDIETALGLWLALNLGTDTEDYTAKLLHLQNQLQSNEEQRNQLQGQMNNIAEAIAEHGYLPAFKDKAKAIKADIKSLETDSESLALAIRELQQPKTDIASLMQHWHSKRDDHSYRTQILRLLEAQQVSFTMDNGIVTLSHKDRLWTLEGDFFKPQINLVLPS